MQTHTLKRMFTHTLADQTHTCKRTHSSAYLHKRTLANAHTPSHILTHTLASAHTPAHIHTLASTHTHTHTCGHHGSKNTFANSFFLLRPFYFVACSFASFGTEGNKLKILAIKCRE